MLNKESFAQQQLVSLRTRLLVMCASSGVAVENAVSALEKLDVAVAASIIENDKDINELEIAIDDDALKILARAQPFASDLRFIVGAMCMVSNVERVGDEACNIAEACILLHDAAACPIMDEVLQFLRQSYEKYTRAVECFRASDAATAQQLFCTEDDAIEEEVRLLQICMQGFGEKDIDAQCFMHVILIIRAVTRIHKHAINIAEQVYFMQKGKNLKHSRALVL